MNKLIQKIEQPISNSVLILFRIFLGLLVTAESWGAILTGWANRVIVSPEQRFTFIGFEFLEHLQGEWMYAYFIFMGILGLCIATGFFYKITMPFYTLMWAGIYFSQKSSYNNHYYLLLLIAAVMCFLPAHLRWSLDVKQGRVAEQKTMPYGIKLFFIIQMTIVYTYASIAKIYPDWLEAKPIALWFGWKKDYPLIGGLLQYSFVHYVFAYVGILFDLLVSPLLMIKKTRKITFMIGIVFHLTNSIIFQIGIFPFFALAVSLFFFDPNWFEEKVFKNKEVLNLERQYKLSIPLIYIAAFYLFIQALLPLRHHLIKGDVLLTEEGHRLSWRMMLRSKAGRLKYYVKNQEGKLLKVIYPYEAFTRKQASSMRGRPDMIWQGAQKLHEEYKQEFPNQEIGIYAESKVLVNGRKKEIKLIDSKVDLSKVDWKWYTHNHWIVAMKIEE